MVERLDVTPEEAEAEFQRRRAARKPLPVDLALQGGGAHGAFTWGVLDRLLDEPWMEVEGISGTSAGAMNAAVFAHGMAKGGHQGARAALAEFWGRVSDAARTSPLRRGPLDVMMGNWTLDNSPGFIALDFMARVLSPYMFGDNAPNPLRDILCDMIDFAALADGPIKLFITATNVRTGRGRVFRKHEISADVLLASACLPTLYQAVEIDGEHYWDGGYSGNPTLTPLVNECVSDDTFLVQINPVERSGPPRSAREIQNRLNEVSFNAVMLKELRMMALLKRVAGSCEGEGRNWTQMRIHRIASPMMTELGYSSKLNAEGPFLKMLFDEGRRCADQFGREQGPWIGVRSTFDVDGLLDGV
jgi:NTE family protein